MHELAIGDIVLYIAGKECLICVEMQYRRVSAYQLICIDARRLFRFGPIREKRDCQQQGKEE
jgi:hypothetical protein